MTQGAGRIKKSYSLSRESEQFVRRIRKARKITSDSEALDQLLRESMAAHQQSSIDVAYKAYYDTAPDTAMSEERTWASFAESEMAALLK